MAQSRCSWQLVGTVLAVVGFALGHAEVIRAPRIVVPCAEYAASKAVAVKVEIVNSSSGELYVAEEPALLWVDEARRTLWIAHHAFTTDRESNLRGAASTLQMHLQLSRFKRIAPGGKYVMDVEFPAGLAPGLWEVQGKISLLPEVESLRGLHGSALASRMAELDTVLDCLGSVVRIVTHEVRDCKPAERN